MVDYAGAAALADGRKLADRIAAAIELESAAWLPPDEEGA
jgi:hypothetical protein